MNRGLLTVTAVVLIIAAASCRSRTSTVCKCETTNENGKTGTQKVYVDKVETEAEEIIACKGADGEEYPTFSGIKTLSNCVPK